MTVPGPANRSDSARILLFTGKGGVGKTTLAAASAVATAEAGHRTLVMSTDPAHSLADVLGIEVPAGVPATVTERLSLQHIDSRMLLERSWSSVQRYLTDVMRSAGVDTLEAEELTVLPGAEEVLALLEVRDQVRSGRYDVVILDCAPTAETLRLLALPEALDWYMRRIWPVERKVVTALRRPLGRAAGVPMPEAHVLDAVERLHNDLSDVRELLISDSASVRLVLTPDTVVLAEARRTLTSLSLYGYRVDGIIANRVFAAEGGDPWREGWAKAQAVRLEQARADMAPLPVLTSGYGADEPIGLADLLALAQAVYPQGDPLGLPVAAPPLSLEQEEDEVALLLSLPLAVKGQVDLAERSGELVVTSGAYRRVIALPTLLQRYRIVGAKFSRGVLRVRFAA
ncbi:MAG: ArsA family ATPase [Actinobacteria bacterium]|nr:ArsA family ATPase [Actinomycetota bacterium]